MKRTTIYRYLPLIFLCVVSLYSPNAFAQCQNELSIDKVRVKNEKVFFVTFDYSTNWKEKDQERLTKAVKPSNWIFFSPTLLQKAKAATDKDEKARLYEAATPDIGNIKDNGVRALEMTMVNPILPDETYLVNVSYNNDLIIAKCVGDALAVKVEKRTPPSGTASSISNTQPAASSKQIVLSQVKERKDADIYIEGTAEGARKTTTFYTIDATIKKAINYNREEPEYFWQPFFNIKASTNKKADPDSLDFGINFENPTKTLPKNIFKIKRLYFTEAAKIEANKDFKDVNFVGDFRLRLVSKILNLYRVNIVPFFGVELGRNFRSPVLDARDKSIVRPLFGTSLYLNIYTSKKETGYKKLVTFETFYERRFLLKREIALDKNDDGDYIGVPMTKAPRDYLKSSLTYDFARNFGFKLNYEYGSLPPLFKIVDSKFSLGLVFKGKFERK